MNPRVSVVTASRNETAMLVMTAISVREALAADGLEGEFFVVDNSDPQIHRAVQDVMHGQVKSHHARIVHEPTPSLAKAVDRAHREALHDIVFYIDAHCLIAPGTLRAIVDFYQRHAGERIGFVHAPIQWAHRSDATRMTHFGFADSPLGSWAGGGLVTHEQKVTWKGMPHAIQKSVYADIGGLGCMAQHRLGWSIMRYLGIRPWVLGYQNWAIPHGTVYHFGEWPASAKKHAIYRHYQNSGPAVGAGLPLTAYVYADEAYLRSTYEASGMAQHFKDIDHALATAKQYGTADRTDLQSRATFRSLPDLLASPPWTIQPNKVNLPSTN